MRDNYAVVFSLFYLFLVFNFLLDIPFPVLYYRREIPFYIVGNILAREMGRQAYYAPEVRL
jgi:hypothetical protein